MISRPRSILIVSRVILIILLHVIWLVIPMHFTAAILFMVIFLRCRKVMLIFLIGFTCRKMLSTIFRLSLGRSLTSRSKSSLLLSISLVRLR